MARLTRIATFSLLILLSQTVGCVIYPYRAELEHRDTAAFDGVHKVAVETRNGAIEVQCDAQRKDVDIQSFRSANGLSEADARQIAEKIEIKVERDPGDAGLLHIAAKMPVVEMGRNQSARFRIQLPPTAELVLDTSNGRITAGGCEKNVSANTSNGRIAVERCKGDVEAHTSNGHIVANDIAGNVDAQSTNGGIDLTRVGKSSIKARTSNGRVRVVEASGEATVRSTNGSVEVRLKSTPPSPHIEVVTSNGHVELEVPRTVNAELDMNTSNGRVHADLQDVRISDLDSGRSRLRARLNDGGGTIDVQSSNGSLTLRAVGDAPATTVKPAASRS